MIKRSVGFISVVIILSIGGCIKETYNMNKLSDRIQISPTMALSAVKGDVSFSDMVKPNDSIVFGQDKSVKLIFKVDTIFDFSILDFASSRTMTGLNDKIQSGPKGPLWTAIIKPDTVDFDIKDILKHITGTFNISNPSLKINYSNSFSIPVELNLDITGKRGSSTADLNLAPLTFLHTAAPGNPAVKGSFLINKSNSTLPQLMSLPPEKTFFSGNVVIDITGITNPVATFLLANSRLFASLEVEVPLEFRMNNLQFTDTLDNFLKDKDGSSDNPVKPENFELLRVDINANNGFPLGVSLKMSLYDTLTGKTKSTIDATEILKPAPVDSNGKATGATATTTQLEFSKQFFSSISSSDKIIFQFTLDTSGNGTQDVIIYSDYRIEFTAALVVKPVIKNN